MPPAEAPTTMISFAMKRSLRRRGTFYRSSMKG
jgi:hypothetical protein